eukprot:1998132-Prymnesium_polylepis.1
MLKAPASRRSRPSSDAENPPHLRGRSCSFFAPPKLNRSLSRGVPPPVRRKDCRFGSFLGRAEDASAPGSKATELGAPQMRPRARSHITLTSCPRSHSLLRGGTSSSPLQL